MVMARPNAGAIRRMRFLLILVLSVRAARDVGDLVCVCEIGERFTVRYRWTQGTIAIWDNRCTQHFVLNDFEGERIIQRVTVMGDKPAGIAPPRWAAWVRPGPLSATSRLDRQLHQFLTREREGG